jgi:hypothetical protein
MNTPINLDHLDIQSIRNYCFNLGQRITQKLDEVARYDMLNGTVVIIYKDFAVVTGTDANHISETAADIRDAIETRSGMGWCRHGKTYGCPVCERWICENCRIGHAPDCADRRDV